MKRWIAILALALACNREVPTNVEKASLPRIATETIAFAPYAWEVIVNKCYACHHYPALPQSPAEPCASGNQFPGNLQMTSVPPNFVPRLAISSGPPGFRTRWREHLADERAPFGAPSLTVAERCTLMAYGTGPAYWDPPQGANYPPGDGQWSLLDDLQAGKQGFEWIVNHNYPGVPPVIPCATPSYHTRVFKIGTSSYNPYQPALVADWPDGMLPGGTLAPITYWAPVLPYHGQMWNHQGQLEVEIGRWCGVAFNVVSNLGGRDTRDYVRIMFDRDSISIRGLTPSQPTCVETWPYTGCPDDFVTGDQVFTGFFQGKLAQVYWAQTRGGGSVQIFWRIHTRTIDPPGNWTLLGEFTSNHEINATTPGGFQFLKYSDTSEECKWQHFTINWTNAPQPASCQPPPGPPPCQGCPPEEID